MKCCQKCKLEKPLSEFSKERHQVDGLQKKCRDCGKAYYREKFFINLEQKRKAKRKSQDKYRKSEKGKAVASRHISGWIDKNLEKKMAHKLLNKAIYHKIIVRQPCELCGNKKVHAHHDAYTRPLDVVWLCPKHHSNYHLLEKKIKTSLNMVWIPL